MPYSVKVNFGQNLSIECFGDEVKIVTQLLNETTRKLFPTIPAAKIELQILNSNTLKFTPFKKFNKKEIGVYTEMSAVFDAEIAERECPGCKRMTKSMFCPKCNKCEFCHKIMEGKLECQNQIPLQMILELSLIKI